MPTRLIVGADDFGWTRGINRGILEAHERGIVTATSLMVNAPYAEEAVKAARAFPKLDVGVHLNLVDGSPVLPATAVPSLVDAAGRFLGLKELKFKAITRRLKLSELIAEFEAQIRRALELGVVPSHIDSHHHVHIFPTIHRAIPAALANAMNAPVRGYRYRLVFSQRGPRWIKSLRYYASYPRRLATHQWAGWVTRYFQRQRLLMADVMLIPAREQAAESPKTTPEGWGAIIAATRPNCVNEVFCHPGYVDDGYCGRYRQERERELHALISPQVRIAVERANLELCGYSAIRGAKNDTLNRAAADASCVSISDEPLRAERGRP